MDRPGEDIPGWHGQGLLTRGGSERVAAIYKFPMPIWVTTSCLGKTYSSGCGELRFDVVMPSGQPSNGGRPESAGLEFPESFKGESEGWTANYASFVPDRLKPATAVIRIAIDAVEAPRRDGQAWTGPDQQLARQINLWFDRVRTWVEILTGQDLDPNHRVYDAEEIGAGLTFVEPKRERSMGIRLTTQQILPVDEGQCSCLLWWVWRNRLWSTFFFVMLGLRLSAGSIDELLSIRLLQWK